MRTADGIEITEGMTLYHANEPNCPVKTAMQSDPGVTGDRVRCVTSIGTWTEYKAEHLYADKSAAQRGRVELLQKRRQKHLSDADRLAWEIEGLKAEMG